jgi:hypothetical protein
MPLPPVPPGYTEARTDLHRVAVHVLARRRHALTGRFGLRPAPGGFATPWTDRADGGETLRVSGTDLVRERVDGHGAHTLVVGLAGANLAGLAAAVEVDLDPGFTVGTDTPALGDVEAPLAATAAAVGVMAHVLGAGAIALDRTLGRRGAPAAPTIAQLWPEHFDLGLDVAVGGGRVNLGISVGDGHQADPYAYVGPWGAERPGDPEFWTAPFGAVLGYGTLVAAADPMGAMVDFFERGLGLLG